MPRKFAPDDLPELFGAQAADADALRRAMQRGEIRRLATGIYTTDTRSQPDAVVRRNLWQVVALVAPDAVISDRSALEGGPSAEGSIYVVSRRARPARLPGLVVRPRRGAPALDSDMELPGGIHMASRARAMLENLRPSRSRGGRERRTLGDLGVETAIERMLRTSGSPAVNRLRDDARQMAAMLGLTSEFGRLNALIGALHGTRDAPLLTDAGRARRMHTGYAPDRIELLQLLHTELRSIAPVMRLAPAFDDPRLRHLPFFDAYFSNYIEGTQFDVQVAIDIVYKGHLPESRPADAHDVLGTWRIVRDEAEMKRLPHTPDELLDLLLDRHRRVMAARPEARPGRFKTEPNRFGTTRFVEPELVRGTLLHGFELYHSLESAFERATFVMFLVAEVHPFTDGNGRIARVMMNAELAAAGERRIVIPAVYRNNYLQALRALTHNSLPRPLWQMLDFAQRYVAAIDFSDIHAAIRVLRATHAFDDPNHADEVGVRLRLPTPADDTVTP